MEQGRLAALAAFDEPPRSMHGLLPYGIYTIPEISFVGRSERELTDESVPYVVGMARYRELARGEIAGDRSGLLKLLVHADDGRLLGVHIFGTSATELVHVGQMAMAGGLGVDDLVDAVFNVPDLQRRLQGRRARRRQPAQRATPRTRRVGGVRTRR